MNRSLTVLIVILLISILPLVSVILLSFESAQGPGFYYYKILQNSRFLGALQISVSTSFLVGILAVFSGFLISLTWFSKKQFKHVKHIRNCQTWQKHVQTCQTYVKT